jgi:hypothetical protein
MVGAAWEGFMTELQRWADAGLTVEFWWRDDDACRPEAALARLYALASAREIPLAVAAVPETSVGAAFAGLGAWVTVIQHGADHLSRAAKGEKKTEFPSSEPVEAALERLAAGRHTLETVVPGRFLPVLAPPWNRLPASLAARLPEAGYRGLSTFKPRESASPVPGLVQVNTHVDIIDWKGSRGFCGIDAALGQAVRHLAARREGTADPSEPTGWLTHHAVHDAACWDFLENVFDATKRIESVAWRSADSLFDSGQGHLKPGS